MTQGTTGVPVVLEGQPLRLHAYNAGIACCGVEYGAAVDLINAAVELAEPSWQLDADAATADVLVISGTVTRALVPELQSLGESMGPATVVVAFGACAATGGPYWDSYAIVDGADRFMPVDVYVPGCPPPPEALLEGLRSAAAVVASR